LVTFNGVKYLPFCLNSLAKQTFQDFFLLIVDNCSQDRTVGYLKENFPQIKLVEHQQNIGFAKAHNQGISWTDSQYVMLLNQDVILEEDYLEKALDYLDNHADIAVLGGKTKVWDFYNNFKTNFIDSIGLKVYKNHRVVDIGQGEPDQSQYDQIQEVFGISGSLPIYRRTALEQVKIQFKSALQHQEYFDEDFFSYKEDVDLSFRLRLAGLKSVYFPDAVAYHDRSVKRARQLNDKATRQSRKAKDAVVKAYSYKNHLLLLLKNEFFINFLKYFPFILLYELKKLVFILLFERTSLNGIGLFLQQKSKILKKRGYIIKHIRKIGADDLAQWYR